jgi:DNA-binding Xre family transcriptional regulator
MAIEVKVENNIEEQYEKYKQKTGATQKWVADKLGMSKQSFNALFSSDNITIKKLIAIAYIFQCNIEDLVKYEIIDKK